MNPKLENLSLSVCRHYNAQLSYIGGICNNILISIGQ